MQRWLLVLAVVGILAGPQVALADEGKDEMSQQAARCMSSEQVNALLADRGCCSHHKGQCGCKGGRVTCCDGTVSPSCRCEADAPVKAEN